MNWLSFRFTAPLALAALFVTVGCKEKTFESPTEVTPLRKLETESETHTGLFIENVNRYALDLTTKSLFTQSTESVVVSPISLYVHGLGLLNAASGETYEGIAQHLGVTAPDYTPLNLGANDWLVAHQGQKDPQIAVGLFTIWPIKVEAPFANRLAATLGIDIQKLGAASLASQQALDNWVARQTKVQGLRLNAPLERTRDIMISLNTVVFQPGGLINVASRQTATTDGWHLDLWDIAGTEWQLASFDGPEEFPDYDTYQTLLQNLQPNSEQIDLDLQIDHIADLNPLYRETGMVKIVQGPLDLRYMSLELNGNYHFSQNVHFVRLDLGESNVGLTPTRFLVRSKENGVIAFIGSQR